MRKKILLVDDNTELLEILRLNFRSAGYSIATAEDGIEALKKARTIKPHIILLDLMLPELDGFAVCETLRRDPATAPIPIIMFSGLNGQMARFAGLECGGTEFVSKPVSPKALVEKVEAMLGDSESAVDAVAE